MKKDIVLVGASGFGKEVLWLLEENNKVNEEWNILGLIDKDCSSNRQICGYPVLGNDDWLLNYEKPLNVVCCVANPDLKIKITQKLNKNSNLIFPTIISCDAKVSGRVSLGKGCIICAGSIITVDVEIGDFVCVNLDCTIGHDARLGNYVTLYSSINISGNTYIGEATEIGTGSHIIHNIKVGERTMISAGSVVLKDVPSRCMVFGNPAKFLIKKDLR